MGARHSDSASPTQLPFPVWRGRPRNFDIKTLVYKLNSVGPVPLGHESASAIAALRRGAA